MSAKPPQGLIQNHKHCESVSKGPGGEERRERQGSADPGSGIPATPPELLCSFLVSGPARPATREQQEARFLPAFLSSLFLKELSPGVQRHPHTAGAHPRWHSPRPHSRQRTDARAGALSASPAAASTQPDPTAAAQRLASAFPPRPHSFRLSQPRRKCPDRPPTMKTCVRQLAVEASSQGVRRTQSGGSGRERHRS